MLQLPFAHDNTVENTGLTFSTLPEQYNKHRMFWQHLLRTLETEFAGNTLKSKSEFWVYRRDSYSVYLFYVRL